MTKIKLITNFASLEELETEVNSWLADKNHVNIDSVDIKEIERNNSYLAVIVYSEKEE